MEKKYFTRDQKETLDMMVSNPLIPEAERRDLYEAMREELMNPFQTFDPGTFDHMSDVEGYDARKRVRVAPGDRLPTMGMLPKQIMEGQMIGLYESKQDLYLIMAYYINQLLDRIEVLEKLNNPQN